MSTIVCAGDGIVASDSQNNITHRRVPNPTPKLIKTKSGIYGIVGVSLFLAPMIKWFEAGCVEDDYPVMEQDDKFNFLIFHPTHCEVYLAHTLYPDTYNYPCAFGSGADFALGAISMGAGSIRAVEVACEHDTQSGGPIRSFPLKRPSVVPKRSASSDAPTSEGRHKGAKQAGEDDSAANSKNEGEAS